MGSFNDLPKDVIWLIFKEVTIDFLAQHYKAIFSLYDHFLLPDGHISTRMWWLGTKMQTLSLISRASLTTIRSKCHRKYSDLWSLKPGAWTTEDITRVYRCTVLRQVTKKVTFFLMCCLEVKRELKT
jgi:hypothetical protein